MGVIADKACRVHFRSADCPVPILTLATPKPGSQWAEGLLRAPILSRAVLERQLAGRTAVYTIRLNDYDPLVALGKVPASSRPSWVVPFFEGPFTPAELFSGGPNATPAG